MFAISPKADFNHLPARNPIDSFSQEAGALERRVGHLGFKVANVDPVASIVAITASGSGREVNYFHRQTLRVSGFRLTLGGHMRSELSFCWKLDMGGIIVQG